MLCAPHLGLLLVDRVAGRVAGMLLGLCLGVMLLMDNARRTMQVVGRALAWMLLLVMWVVLYYGPG